MERIATEECFDNSKFVVIKNKKFMHRERSESTSSYKIERNISTKPNSIMHNSDNSIKSESCTDEQEGGAGCQGDPCNSNSEEPSKGYESKCSSRSGNEHLLGCLRFWQDNVYTNFNKA